MGAVNQRKFHLVLLACSGCALIFLAAGAIAAGALSEHFDQKDRSHWAFQKVARPEVPQVRNTQAVRNPIDNFIFAELEKNKITPAERAGKPTLLRRAYLDLIGVPPTPEQLDAFLADKT